MYKNEDKKNTELCKIVLLTDISDYVKNRVKSVGLENNIDIYTTSWFAQDILNNKTFSNVKQDPLLKMNIKEKVDRFLDKKEMIIICLSHVDDDLCQLVNYLSKDKEILYGIMDKEFAYLFGTKMKYTGCYDCFSKRVYSRMKMDPIRNIKLKRKDSCIEKEYFYVIDFMTTLLLKNCKEYTETGAMPILGRIAAIYTRTLEVRYENLLRMSFCNTCGYIGAMHNKERNLKMKNLLKSEEFCYEG